MARGLEEKPRDRIGPPNGYPKEIEKYADPLNWKYPLHTPFHARASTRYFNKETNRETYAGERAYIDSKIKEALLRFGIAFKVKEGLIEKESEIIQEDIPLTKNIEEMDVEDLLLLFLGRGQNEESYGDGGFPCFCPKDAEEYHSSEGERI